MVSFAIGMSPIVSKLKVYNTTTEEGINTFKTDIETYGEDVIDFIELDDETALLLFNTLELKYDNSLDAYHGLNVNIALASAITLII